MSGTDDLIQNVIDTMDTAKTQRINLTELLDSLQMGISQVRESASASKKKVQQHFADLEKAVCKMLSQRMSELLRSIDGVEKTHLDPLLECEEMITQALTEATQCMEKGGAVLANSPEENVDALVQFKNSMDINSLNILPEVPNLSEVAYIEVEFPGSLVEKLQGAVGAEGKLYDRAPVQITEVCSCPGGVMVKWEEVDDDVEAGEFRLQYCYGQATATDSASKTFHTAYTGTNTKHVVKHLRINTPYSFRVCCRADKGSPWSMWSVPKVASTSIPHYEWQADTPGYCTSNESKVGTRESGITRILYSKGASYMAGSSLTFRVLDTGETSPLDGVGISVSNEVTDNMKREGAVCLGSDGSVCIDGQEMKTRLPSLARNSSVTIVTESLPNGKVRVSVQVEEKELTFDWSIDRPVALSMIGGLNMMGGDKDSQQSFHFAMQFSHEDWKVAVE